MSTTGYIQTCADQKRYGGIESVWLADEALVSEDDYTIATGEITAITSLSEFAKYQAAPFFAQHTVTDEMQEGNNMLLTHTFVMYFDNFTPALREMHNELRDLCGVRILYKDQGDSGTASRTWLIGHEDDLYMKLQTVEGDSGRQLEDGKGVTFTFVGKAKVPAYPYTGADPA